MELFGWTHLLGYQLSHTSPDRIFAERAGMFRQACLTEIRRHPTKKWGNKLTTEHLFGLEDHNALNPPYQPILDRFFREVVPEFQIVFILRDGRTCVSSKVRRTGQTWEHAAYRWHYAVRVLKTLQQLTRPVCIVRFEDLVREPRASLERICDYLLVPFHQSMLRQTQSELLMPEYRNVEFDRSKLAVPDLPEHIAAFLRPDLEYCGYL